MHLYGIHGHLRSEDDRSAAEMTLALTEFRRNNITRIRVFVNTLAIEESIIQVKVPFFIHDVMVRCRRFTWMIMLQSEIHLIDTTQR